MKSAKTKALRLSRPQIRVLLLGVDHELHRNLMGWHQVDDRVREKGSVSIIYAVSTIKSLYKRGLLDGNFNDERVLQGHCFPKLCNLDGALNPVSKGPRFKVWTSALGRKVLAEKGFLPEDTPLNYH